MLSHPAILLLVFVLFSPVASRAAEAEKSPAAAADEYPELVTKKGDVFRKVAVMRVDADALLVRHEGGMARVSLFDLSPELQARYDFDPIAALKRYQTDLAIQREQRQTALLETEKRQAAAVRAAATREELELAKAEWIPVEGKVIALHKDGVLLNAKRIQIIPTQVRSTLGFLNEGPPKRVLVAFSAGPVLLLGETGKLQPGQEWKGYINPVIERFVIDHASGLPTIPAHRGASAAP